VFVQDFVVVERPYDEVAERLVGDAKGILGEAFTASQAEGERLRVRVGLAGWPDAFAKTVELSPGPIRLRPEGGLLLAFSWQAVGSTASLFPRLDADLDVAPFGTDQTVVSLGGRYVPPAGALGRVADELVLHRLAGSTLRAFLNGLAERLTTGDRPRVERTSCG
jgi:hypothetical protein